MTRTRIGLLASVALLAVAALAIALSQRGADMDISDTIGYVQAAQQLARGEGLAFNDPHNAVDRRYYMRNRLVGAAASSTAFGVLQHLVGKPLDMTVTNSLHWPIWITSGVYVLALLRRWRRAAPAHTALAPA